MTKTFFNALTGQEITPEDWQAAMAVGDCYVIESGAGTVYGQIASAEDTGGEGFFWVKGFSVHCPDGEMGLVCICDMTRQITPAEFEEARARGWQPTVVQPADMEDRRAILRRYLETYAVPLAARAWHHYLDMGRGVLVVYDNQVVDYVPAAIFIARLMADVGPDHPLLDQVAKYDPNLAFMIYYSKTGWPAAIGQSVLPMVPPPAAASARLSADAAVRKVNREKKKKGKQKL